MDKYAAEFCRAQDASGASNVAIAQAMGIHPTNVSQWRSGNRPIPADKAVALASLVGADAARISEAYGRVIGSEARHSGVREPVLPSQSQSVRLDPDMIAETVKALRIDAERTGHTFSMETDEGAALFLHWYAIREQVPDLQTLTNLVRLRPALGEALSPQGANTDGRGEGVPITGTHGPRKASGGARRKT